MQLPTSRDIELRIGSKIELRTGSEFELLIGPEFDDEDRITAVRIAHIG